MTGLLSIPCSNADSERWFSILRKIHTDQRPSLKQSTINSLMTIKFNSNECCYNATFSDELLTKCKKATVASLNRVCHNYYCACVIMGGRMKLNQGWVWLVPEAAPEKLEPMQ